MATLGGAQDIAMFNGRLLVKGQLAFFVAVEKIEDTIIWHVIKTDDRNSNPYITALRIEPDNMFDMSCITTCRHFVG